MSVPKTSGHIQINIRMPNPSQEPPASSKTPNEDLKDIDALCTLKIKIESQNSDHGFIKDQWPYPNQDQDAKPQSGTSNILQSPKWRLKGHWCSLHLPGRQVILPVEKYTGSMGFFILILQKYHIKYFLTSNRANIMSLHQNLIWWQI